jgi:hypothetical protein
MRPAFDLLSLASAAQDTIRPAASDAACLERAARERGGSNGGGGGIRTRVRKHIPAGIYDAYPPLKCRTRREEAEKPPGTSPEKSRR